MNILFGYSNLPVVYVLFTILQVALSIKGFKEIKWLENVSCVFIIAILVYMLYVVNTKYAVDISASFAGIKGTWGLPFWAATTSFLGIYATMITNASDYSRNLKEGIGPVKASGIYTIAILPVTLFMNFDNVSRYINSTFKEFVYGRPEDIKVNPTGPNFQTGGFNAGGQQNAGAGFNAGGPYNAGTQQNAGPQFNTGNKFHGSG